MIDDPVGHAVRLDAACVVVNLLDVPGQDGLRRDCLEAISHLRAECDRAGMPLMVEPLAFEASGGGGYESSGDVDRIMRPCPAGGRARRRRHQGRPDRRHLRVPPRRRGRPRPAARCAAVAASPTGRSSSAPTPCSSRARAGIVYGRNVIQHESPAAMTAALMAVVHGGATVDEALARLA